MLSQRRHEQLRQVIEAAFPAQSDVQYRLLGHGDFHQVYEVSSATLPCMVVKFRKRFPYGTADEQSVAQILGEYQGTALFYKALADTELGVPAIYQSAVLDEQCWVLESKLEHATAFAELSTAQAYQAGASLARALVQAYRKPAPCAGSGKLIVNESGDLAGQHDTTPAFQAEFEKRRFSTLLQELTATVDSALLQSALVLSYQLLEIHAWPLTLVNADLHPENLVLQSNGQLSVMDPQVSIESGLRFLAHFWVNCHYFWPLLLRESLAQTDELNWVANLAPLADGFLQTCLAQQVSLAGFYAESFLRLMYLLWRHQEYVTGRSAQGSDQVLGTLADAQARIPALLLQLQQLAAYLIEVGDE